jgi:hypothetical protein
MKLVKMRLVEQKMMELELAKTHVESEDGADEDACSRAEDGAVKDASAGAQALTRCVPRDTAGISRRTQ